MSWVKFRRVCHKFIHEVLDLIWRKLIKFNKCNEYEIHLRFNVVHGRISWWRRSWLEQFLRRSRSWIMSSKFEAQTCGSYFQRNLQAWNSGDKFREIGSELASFAVSYSAQLITKEGNSHEIIFVSTIFWWPRVELVYHKNVFAIIVEASTSFQRTFSSVQLLLKRLKKTKWNCDQSWNVLFSREPFKENIPMGNSRSRGMMFILTPFIFLFLNLSREKWFNEPIAQTTTKATAQRRFKCFPKLIQTTNNQREKTFCSFVRSTS